jgi:Raf kinase inhibitor-like YbhB/YbcL family protein
MSKPISSGTRGLLVLVFAAGLVLSGCSSGSDTATPGESTTTIAPGAGSTTTPGSAAPTPTTESTMPDDVFLLGSPAFADDEPIPVRYACTEQGGEGASPPLRWGGVPEEATTLVLVVHDPDAPRPGGFTHLVTTLPVDGNGVADGANETAGDPMAAWIGPCPPSGEHRYVFTLLAFGPGVEIPAGADKAAIDAVAGDALATSILTGRFGTA